MFCPNCGTEILKDALFCGNCGFKVEDFVIKTPADKPAASFEFTPAQEETPAEPEVITFEAAPAAEPVKPAAEPAAATPVFQTTQPAPVPAQNYSNAEFQAGNQFQPLESNDTLITVTKIFLIIGTVVAAICGFLIPLAWCLPITLSIFKSFKTGRPIGMGMKICTLLFVSLISGICLLCMKDDRR